MAPMNLPSKIKNLILNLNKIFKVRLLFSYCAYHTCLPSQFKCRNGRCLPMQERW